MTRWQTRGIGLALALLTTIAVAVNQRDIGIARDEVVYMQAGARYADWWLTLFEHGPGPDAVTRTFGGPGATDNNREHPPVMKTLFGLSHELLHDKLHLLDDNTAFRLPSAVMHGAAVWVVYAFALALWGLAEAIVAALLLLLLPRALFHAGLACFDAPTMTWWIATVYAYWRAVAGGDVARRWPWQVGVLWGLALGTKHTALLLPFALGLHYLISGYRARPRDVTGAAVLRAVLAYRWRVLVSLAVLGPLTLYLVWPWLWYAPIRHVREWLAFHATHVHYNYEYLGANWNAPRFPWHVALITTLFTVPVATLAAALIGGARWVRERGARPGAPLLLLALSAAASIGPFFLGTTPIFGAEKHWMPVLPTICLAGAAGVVWAARQLPHPRVAVPALAALVALAGLSEVSVAEPYALTWYNTLAGGAPGAADLGMNRQFWGVAMRGVLPQLPVPAQPTPIYTHDASPAWPLYLRDGLAPRTLVDAGWEQAGIDRSQLAVVIHERHFNRHDYLIWKSYGTVRPIFVLRSAGVPIASLYRRP